MEGVRHLARREKRQISQVVNELLAEGLFRHRQKRKVSHFNLPSFDMGRPKVNISDRDALEAAMEE
ncbi:MAG: hypothetical protein KJ626_14840 [Verrucomicrobia bacterium]|nr:hypothetical protein [Verrucomicrobiota bacterium]